MIEKKFICSSVAKDFLNDDDNHVKMLMGPVGSGKSSACCVHMYMTAMKMPRGKDGKRRCKWGVVRSTYSQLKTTTIRTWLTWFPEEVFGKIRGDSPITHKISSDEIEIEIIFLAVESLSDVQRLKSLELTAIYINETQFFSSRELMQTFIERTNRYPDKHILGGSLGKPLVIMDCNPPSTRHWIYQIFEKERPEGFKIYKMPPALIKKGDNWENNPNADYLWQLAEEGEQTRYYLDLAKGATDEYIKVSLLGEYGVLEEGRAVHPEYNDRLHFSEIPVKAMDGLEIGLGWDFGNTPACAVVQMMPDGSLCVIQEYWTEYMSVRDFASNVVIPSLDSKYPWWRSNYISYHDPSGDNMNPDGGTCASILHECGVYNSRGANSNNPDFRRDALKYFLTRMPGGKPGFLVSSNCEMIREGLMGKFKYEIIKSSQMSDQKLYNEKPCKNLHSHICEALEYIATGYASTSKLPPKSPYKAYSISSSWAAA